MKLPIRVLIADDLPSITNRIRNILSKDNRFEVVAIASNGYETVMLTALHQPDLLLLDIEMEEKTSGLKAANELLNQFPELKIIMLTIHERDEYLFSAFQIGVIDYLFKDATPTEIIRSLINAHINQPSIQPRIASRLLQEFSRAKKSEQDLLTNLEIFKSLTPTEIAILKLYKQGLSRNEICDIRHIELSTLKSEINSILKKFQCMRMKDVLPKIAHITWFDLD